MSVSLNRTTNITFSIDRTLIIKAKNAAQKEKKSLNKLFLEWLIRYVNQKNNAKKYKILMSKLNHVNAGKHFTREELNER
ncbi:MAG: hypothetical protein JW855_04355 [Gammaproteobacteria bacterium]|nr:hypothetical protein [Gammaproteobacteria bacterium]